MTPSQPSIFVVNHYPVLPAEVGGQRAVLGLACELALAGDTELVWTERKAHWSREMASGGRLLRVTAVPNRWLQRKVVKLAAHWLGAPDGDIGSMFFSGGNRSLIDYLLQRVRDGDIVVLAHPWLWPAVRRVVDRRCVRLVYDAHNVEHRLKAESLADGVISRWVVRRVAHMEIDLLRRADLTLACTALDAQQLAAAAALPLARFVVGSKGVDTSDRAAAIAAARLLSPRRRTRTAVFVGSNHPPNNAAARWIVDILARRCPDWKFRIVGTCGHHCGVGPRPPNVDIVGPVVDLLAELEGAYVALNPISSGSGVNMKLFEYLQCGLPVLSTPFGSRGLDHIEQNGIQVVALDSFADALAQLGDDRVAYNRLSADGVACVAANFTWDAVGRRVREAVLRPIAQARR